MNVTAPDSTYPGEAKPAVEAGPGPPPARAALTGPAFPGLDGARLRAEAARADIDTGE